MLLQKSNNGVPTKFSLGNWNKDFSMKNIVYSIFEREFGETVQIIDIEKKRGSNLSKISVHVAKFNFMKNNFQYVKMKLKFAEKQLIVL